MITSADIERLKQKYKDPKYLTSIETKSDTDQNKHEEKMMKSIKSVHEIKSTKSLGCINMIIPCSDCQGSGFIQIHYNFQVNTKTCKSKLMRMHIIFFFTTTETTTTVII